MKKVKILVQESFRSSGLFSFLIVLCFLTGTSTQLVAQENAGAEPIFKIYTDNGEVNLKKGIPADTRRLMIRATSDESDLKFRVSNCEVTLVSGGLGRGSMKSSEKIELEEFLSQYDLKDGALLAIEIKTYQSKDGDDVVKSYEPKTRYFNLPIKKDRGE